MDGLELKLPNVAEWSLPNPVVRETHEVEVALDEGGGSY